MQKEHRRLYRPYLMMLTVYVFLIVSAFILDSPQDIARGFWRIITNRGVLITDYMAVGGIGATLVNSASVGIFSTSMLIRVGAKPNGSLIMALWLSVGFAMFGKNVFNMLPLTFGVWLYSRFKKEPFINFTLVALLSATLSPTVSGISFHPDFPQPFSVALGICMGILAGFIFPAVSSFTVRVHGGYNLYNLGFAGGLISTFIVSMLQSVGIEMQRELLWSTGLNLPLSILLYVLSLGLIVYGLFPEGKFHAPQYSRVLKHSGRMVTDFYILYGSTTFFNMGLLGVFATTLMLVYGADLNGATLCGILTIIGFGAFGKHLRNILPVIVGAIICTHVNQWDPTTPNNILAILFSTGLSPIAGQFGIIWGLIAGFLHVNTVMHIGFLNEGLNLYNNGYAAGFVALLLLPIITMLHNAKEGSEKK